MQSGRPLSASQMSRHARRPLRARSLTGSSDRMCSWSALGSCCCGVVELVVVLLQLLLGVASPPPHGDGHSIACSGTLHRHKVR